MKKPIIAALLSISLLAKPARADAGLITVFVATFITYFVIHYTALQGAKLLKTDNNNTKPQTNQ